ncbi:MAG: heme ABC transporter permease CcmC [Gammaproteobacteria bacterium]|nr:heme ABC transporter permease CcmC [Gammaproteobacteria bacterium]
MGSPRWFFGMARPWMWSFAVLGIAMVTTGCIWGLFFAPPDYQQGDSFRIIYIHVPAAHLAEALYVMLGVAGVVFLVWRMKLADMFIAVTAPVGIAITGTALLTGAIWGRPTWGAWWVWDARTTSVLVLFFLYVGLVALRQAIPRAQAAARAASVLAIVGTVNIPIIKYSVDWWLTLHQPASLSTSGASMPASMWVPLVINIFGFYFFIGAVLLGALRHEVLQREAGTQWVRDWVRGA